MAHKALALLLPLTLVWGFSFLFIKVGDEGLTGLQVAGVRITLGAVLLAVIMALRREPWPERGLWGHLLFLGLFSNVIPFSLLAVGEQHIDSSLAGVFNAATPLFTALIAFGFLPGERPQPRQVTGLGVGFAGVVVVFSPWHAHAAGSLGGALACVGAAAGYGIALVYTRRNVQGRASSLSLAAGQLACAALEIDVLVLLVDRHGPNLSGRLVASMLALGLLGTGVAYLLFFQLIATVGPVRASTVTYLVPLVAVALGVAALGEPLRGSTVIGGVVLLAGVALTSRPSGVNQGAPIAGVRPQPD